MTEVPADFGVRQQHTTGLAYDGQFVLDVAGPVTAVGGGDVDADALPFPRIRDVHAQ